MKTSLLILATISISLMTGCSMLQEPVSVAKATRTYNAPADKVFDATISSLEQEGLRILTAEKNLGVIQTGNQTIDAQTAVALFDKDYQSIYGKDYSVRFNIQPTSDGKTAINVALVSKDETNGILEQTYLNRVSEKLGEGAFDSRQRIDIGRLPMVTVTLKDNSSVEGYLLDDSKKEYVRIRLKKGGIMHIERSEIERYTLANAASDARN
jgi:hypothetical protein